MTRCLALAEALTEVGWRVSFIVGQETNSTVPALVTSGYKIRVLDNADHDLEAFREEACGDAELLVVDHYERDVVFERACRPFVRHILVLDDATGRDHDCDLLVDAAATNPALYVGHIPVLAYALTGPAYALMRRAFVAKREAALRRRDGCPVNEILLSFGATDPWNATSLALAGIDRFANVISITVAMSSRAPHLDEVRRKLHGRIRLSLDADMADLMTNADLAIGAAGVSAYERAVLGLPSIMVMTADNQRDLFKLMIDVGAATDGGAIDRGLKVRLGRLVTALLEDCTTRICMAEKASGFCDGQGARRIVQILVDIVRDSTWRGKSLLK